MMPLTDRDFAEIRSNVMREIARRQRRNTFVLAGAVAVAVLAIVFVLIPRPLPRRDAGRIAGATQKPATTTQQPVAQLSVAPAILPAIPKHHKHHHHAKPQPQPQPEPQPVAITVELQTANPDVRIIWIAK